MLKRSEKFQLKNYVARTSASYTDYAFGRSYTSSEVTLVYTW